MNTSILRTRVHLCTTRINNFFYEYILVLLRFINTLKKSLLFLIYDFILIIREEVYVLTVYAIYIYQPDQHSLSEATSCS